MTGTSPLHRNQATGGRRLLFRHAAQLVSLRGPARARRRAEMRELGVVHDGAVLIEGERIFAAGPSEAVERAAASVAGEVEEIDCRGHIITPGLVDCHTHLIFSAPRLDDFERRLAGAGYEEIARSGGGIQQSVARLRTASDEDLLAHTVRWLNEARAHGTTTLEIKSGYGLSTYHELRMLSVAAAAAPRAGVEVVRTFLGAHTVPEELAGDRARYVAQIVEAMLPAVVEHGAAESCDAFCDRAAFSVAEAEHILRRARELGLAVRLHADQFSRNGATQLAVRLKALSADHLDCADDTDVAALAQSSTVATLLPGSNVFMGTAPATARRMIEAGVALALATDFNPGTCPIISLPLIMALACTQLRLSPAEAWSTVTVNAAAALQRMPICGSLETGKRADLAVFAVDDYRAVPYFAGTNLCVATVAAGQASFRRSLETP